MKRLVLLLLGAGLCGAELQLVGVRPTLEEIMSFHIDHKEFSTLIAKRSLKSYIQAFDPDYTYLLRCEAEPYLHLNDLMAERVVTEYKAGKFGEFSRLNKTMGTAIQRARKIRATVKAELLKKTKFDPKEPFTSFAGSTKELHEGIHQMMQNWLIVYAKENKKEVLDAEERLKVLNFYEKKRRQHEDLFLPSDASQTEEKFALTILKVITESLDAHSKYYSYEEAAEIRAVLQKQFCGVGIKFHEAVEGPTVAKVIVGSPAERSGLVQKGDVLREIDGADVSLLYFKDVLKRIEGSQGSKVAFVFEKPSGARVSLDLVRDKVIIEEDRIRVDHESFWGGVIGKITLSSFYDNSDGVNVEKDLREAIKELKATGALKGLIIDLRRNGGGFLHQAVQVAGLFAREGVVVIAKYAGDEVQFSRGRDLAKYYDGPLVLLTSKASASAAEIVAATLRDEGAALVVGDERTYGKGSMQYQTITDAAAKNYFKVTVGRYYTASGRSTQVDGIKADILVPTSFANHLIGERYLQYPIPNIPLLNGTDIKHEVRKICSAYAQRQPTCWEKMVPQLKTNSENRLKANKNFQAFLSIASKYYGSDDLQMREATEIIKDMICLSR